MSDDSKLLKVRGWAGRELRKLAEEEEGASLVFASITLFAVTMSIVFVYQMGLVSTDRLTVQNAADAAAYSAAQVEANSLNSIAQINDGMTYLNYAMLRYTIDIVVYSTMNQYSQHRSPAAPGWVWMGPNGGQEGPNRYRHVQRLLQGNGAYNKGLDWMNELHYAGRIIMAVTPRLAREAAAEVAGKNGAEYVAFSEDLDKAFKVGEGGSEGFSEKAYSNSDQEFNRPMYERYGKSPRQMPELDRANGSPRPVDRELPKGDGAVNWFDATTGRKTGEYYQVRLCWNRQDWNHPGETQHSGSPYSNFPNTHGGPNAHWHANHVHFKRDPFTGQLTIPLPPHGDSPRGATKGGHSQPDDDPSVHGQADDLQLVPGGPHHYVIPCPTCYIGQDPRMAPRPNGGQSQQAEIKKSSDSGRVQNRQQFNLNYQSRGGVFPRPLFMREALLRSGITVAAWREGRGIGNLFPKSEWGMIAVASAQVGLQEQDNVLPLSQLSGGQATYKNTGGGMGGAQKQIPYAANRNGTDDKFANLFYAKQNGEGGVRFGARLVPIARDHTWHPDLYSGGKGLQALLENRPSGGGSGASIWFRAQRGGSTGGGSPPPSLSRLRNFVSVRSDQGLKAFWH